MKSPLAQLYRPMLATLADRVDGTDYVYEIKWDGVRAVTYIDKKQLLIRSRNDLDITHRYPELQALAAVKKSKNAVLDGEIVALDAKGTPSFQKLQKRMLLNNPAEIAASLTSVPICYMIFDILVLNGRSLVDESYRTRRAILSELNLKAAAWDVPDFLEGDWGNVLKSTSKLGLEGVVAKRIDSRYLPGLRSRDWLKLKNMRRQELVIAGYEPGAGARTGSLGALLLGYYDISRKESARTRRPQKLLYAGECGTGFSQVTLDQLTRKLNALKTRVPAFVNPPQGARFVFTKPILVGEFQFTEWTSNKTLRHPSFKGLRADKNPHDVIREVESN